MKVYQQHSATQQSRCSQVERQPHQPAAQWGKGPNLELLFKASQRLSDCARARRSTFDSTARKDERIDETQQWWMWFGQIWCAKARLQGGEGEHQPASHFRNVLIEQHHCYSNYSAGNHDFEVWNDFVCSRVCVCVWDSLEISLLLKGGGVNLCEVVTASRLLFPLSPEFDWSSKHSRCESTLDLSSDGLEQSFRQKQHGHTMKIPAGYWGISSAASNSGCLLSIQRTIASFILSRVCCGSEKSLLFSGLKPSWFLLNSNFWNHFV